MQQETADEVARKGARFKSDFGQRFLERPFCFILRLLPPLIARFRNVLPATTVEFHLK